MPLFKFGKGTAKRIEQKEFSDEKELHELIDGNLEEIFNLRYITDEYITEKHGRIETLAIDEANRPVVIEYKKIKESWIFAPHWVEKDWPLEGVIVISGQ